MKYNFVIGRNDKIENVRHWIELNVKKGVSRYQVSKILAGAYSEHTYYNKLLPDMLKKSTSIISDYGECYFNCFRAETFLWFVSKIKDGTIDYTECVTHFIKEDASCASFKFRKNGRPSGSVPEGFLSDFFQLINEQ